MERFLTVVETAEELRVSDKTVRNLIAAGRLGTTRVGVGGGKLLISRESLESYIAESSNAGTGAHA